MSNGHEISHLCDEAKCFNPNHLIAETKEANLSWKQCRGVMHRDCLGMGHVVFDICDYLPQSFATLIMGKLDTPR